MVPPFIKKDRSTYARSNLFVLASASCYSCAENVLMESVVVAELKFRHVVRKIFFANFIKRPDHTMLEDRPEALDGVGMHRANHVLTFCMINDLVRIIGCSIAGSPSTDRLRANLPGARENELETGYFLLGIVSTNEEPESVSHCAQYSTHPTLSAPRRALDPCEHSFIVRVLRARRAPGHSPLILLHRARCEAGWAGQRQDPLFFLSGVFPHFSILFYLTSHMTFIDLTSCYQS